MPFLMFVLISLQQHDGACTVTPSTQDTKGINSAVLFLIISTLTIPIQLFYNSIQECFHTDKSYLLDHSGRTQSKQSCLMPYQRSEMGKLNRTPKTTLSATLPGRMKLKTSSVALMLMQCSLVYMYLYLGMYVALIIYGIMKNEISLMIFAY
jgi:hypothetical protein